MRVMLARASAQAAARTEGGRRSPLGAALCAAEVVGGGWLAVSAAPRRA